MTTRNTLLGLALACAACCALPLLGAGVALGSALLAQLDLALGLLALTAAGGLLLWRRRRARQAACGCCQVQTGHDGPACRP